MKILTMGIDMVKKIDKYKTLLTFLEIISPDGAFSDLLEAQVNYVKDSMHRAASGLHIDDKNISPEALDFVKKKSGKCLKKLAKFLKKIKGAQYYSCEEDWKISIVKAEIRSFIDYFAHSSDADTVKYYKIISSTYEYLNKV